MEGIFESISIEWAYKGLGIIGPTDTESMTTFGGPRTAAGNPRECSEPNLTGQSQQRYASRRFVYTRGVFLPLPREQENNSVKRHHASTWENMDQPIKMAAAARGKGIGFPSSQASRF